MGNCVGIGIGIGIEKQEIVSRFTKEIEFETKCSQAKHDSYKQVIE